MNTFATIAALVGVLAGGFILRHRRLRRPGAAACACSSSTTPPWPRPWAACTVYGDRRLPAPGVTGILAAAAATAAFAASGSLASATAAGIALIAMLTWLSLYLRVAAPINQALTAVAIAHVTPGNARLLQSRWDSIITTRALLMAAAVAGLAASAATH